MPSFGSHSFWSRRTHELSGYLNVEVTSDQVRLLNPITVDTITGFVFQDDIGGQEQKNISQSQMGIIYGSILSYFYILNSNYWIAMVDQANKLDAVLAGIEQFKMADKENRMRKYSEAEINKK